MFFVQKKTPSLASNQDPRQSIDGGSSSSSVKSSQHLANAPLASDVLRANITNIEVLPDPMHVGHDIDLHGRRVDAELFLAL